jgi:N-acyl-D-amino-acid deacylase
MSAPSLTAQTPLPITGIAVPGLSDFDRMMAGFMVKYGIVGGSLSVTKAGRLVYARGFGFSDREANQPVQPESLFRIASISKPITAVAILKLYEEKKLDLDEKAFKLLDHLQLPPGGVKDARLYEITIRELLQHSSGLVRSCFGQSRENILAAQALGIAPPATAENLVRYGLSRALDFPPGGRYSYSTLGYCVLGRLIEKITGQPYEDYVKATVLAASNIKRMRIGPTLPEERAEGEVRYYDLANAPPQPSVYPPHALVPSPYSFFIAGADSGGGWIASSLDLLRFVTAIDGKRGPALLKTETVKLMLAKPNRPDVRDASVYYGMGWVVRLSGSEAEWRHGGSLAGAHSLLVRRADGIAWAVVFNSEFRAELAFAELDRTLSQAINDVREWPSHDLFGQYP